MCTTMGWLDPVTLLLYVGLFLSTDVGDYFENRVQSPKLRALTDNAIHVIIGSITWCIVNGLTFDKSLVLVSVGASVIDVDHFIEARSFSFDKATHNKYRGWFHCTGLCAIAFLILYRFSKPHAWMFVVSFLPHHIRDAQRRGIYLIPPPQFKLQTPPIPVPIVRVILVLIPIVVNAFAKQRTHAVLHV